ncbi:MAG: DUF5606 domain-containing protein [Flavobacteriales bacterium]|nr:DUF5606 domain-containing protein [Flavobacteriales bacterium]
MVIQEIIAIAGKPGLYRIIITNRANLVVESMLDKKRVSIPGTSRISSLADITMYTTGEDALLMDILNLMSEKAGKSEVPAAKSDPEGVRKFIDGIVPNLDHERVYNSDLKKLVQWFSTLRKNEAFPLTSEVAKEEAVEEAVEEVAEEGQEKKPAAKKPAAKKSATKKPATKKTAIKGKAEPKGKPSQKKAQVQKSTAKAGKSK